MEVGEEGEYIYLSLHCHHQVQELCENRGGRPGLSVLTSLGFRGRKDLLNRASALVTTCP